MSFQSSKSSQTSLLSAEWASIIAFLSISILGSIAGAGSLICLIFPVGSLAIALFLYQRTPHSLPGI